MIAVTPPRGFALVEPGVYRCAYPATTAQVQYLRALRPRTVVQLGLEALPAAARKALTQPAGGAAAGAGAAPVVVDLSPMAWTAQASPSAALVRAVLDYIFDASCHPLVVMCPTGELETSAVVAGLRLVQRWALSSVLSECALYAPTNVPRTDLWTLVEALRTTLLRADYLPARMLSRARPPLQNASFSPHLGPHDGDATPRSSIPDSASATPSSVRAAPSPHKPLEWAGLESRYRTPAWWAADIAAHEDEQALMAQVTLERLPLASLKSRDDAPLAQLLRFDRNPPALGPKSSFTKASVAEEEDA